MRRILARFLLLGVPLLLLLFAAATFLLGQPELAPDTGALDRLGLDEETVALSPTLIGSWLVETAGLVALFLLIQGRGGSWWLDGLVTAWLAWLFRGPLLVLTVTVWSELPREPWWGLSLRYLVLYSVAGLLLAWLARSSHLGRT